MKTKQGGRLLAPSILSADFASLSESVAKVAPYSGLIHVDVMDGHFVPNITLGPVVVEGLKRTSSLPLDCHLMIEAPDRYIADFAKAGAAFLSVHQEACPHLHRTIQRIREEGMRPGVALNPATPIETLDEILGEVDFILIMSVNPGFGGQKFITSSLGKVRGLKNKIAAMGLGVKVEVDGGVNRQTIPPLLEAGTDWFVAGSAIFGAPDPGAEAKSFKEMIDG